jgi:hypothetical protein
VTRPAGHNSGSRVPEAASARISRYSLVLRKSPAPHRCEAGNTETCFSRYTRQPGLDRTDGGLVYSKRSAGVHYHPAPGWRRMAKITSAIRRRSDRGSQIGPSHGIRQ